MKRSRAIAWVVLLVVIAAVAAFCALRPREPVYEGKRLSEWLRDLDDNTLAADSRNRAVGAVLQIGSNCVPTLVELLHSSDSWLKRRLMESVGNQSRIRFHFTTAQERRGWAIQGIKVLGPAAIPMLIDLLNDKGAMTTAMICLSQVGPEVVWPLTRTLTNEAPRVRSAAIVTLGLLRSNGQVAVPALVARLESDEDNRVRASAANALGYIGKDPEVAVPALVKHLSDADPTIRAQAALALAKFGRQAQAGVPMLLKTMRDENLTVRNSAAVALKEIDPHAAAKAGVK